MEYMNKNGLVKVALLLFLLSFATTIVNAQFDQSSLINGDASYYVKSTTTACCDTCYCTKSKPLQCRCVDIRETCHSACKSCICQESLPLKCRCRDINDFCHEPCNSSEAETR